MSMKLVRERDVEKALGKIVEGGGGLYEKFSSPGRRDVPDRLVIEGRGLDRAAHLLHDLLKENNSAEPADRPLATHEGRRSAVRALIAQVIYFVERSEEHTSELQSRENLVCRLLLEKKKRYTK